MSAAATFVAFASYNSIAMLVGESSCSCFGAVQVHPTVALLTDLAALVAVSFWQPGRQRRITRRYVTWLALGANGMKLSRKSLFFHGLPECVAWPGHEWEVFLSSLEHRGSVRLGRSLFKRSFNSVRWSIA